MARMQWIGLAAVGLFLTGCVSQEKYNALKLERDQLSSQLAAAQNDLTAAQAERDSLRKQIELGQGGILSKDALLTNLTTQNSELQKQLAELQLKYEDAIRAAARGGSGGPLPQPLADALQAFANANPDLVDFDASRGIVKFKSDVTFASGSAELTAQAQQVIGRFSQILNSPAAGQFELMVAGHTDNMPVTNPQTIARGHKDNWYLSAHRAISVGRELMSHRVASSRLGVCGYADTKQVASNASESGRQQNRRVEVLILPLKGAAPTVAARPAVTPTINKDAGPRLNKDGAGITPPRVPHLNK